MSFDQQTQKIEWTGIVNYDNGYTNKRLSDTAKHSMEMFFENGVPAQIEWVVDLGTGDGEDDLVEHIGLTFENKTLTDYDGVFEIPEQAIKFIRKQGFIVPKEFEED